MSADGAVPVTIRDLQQAKTEGRRFTMLTAYDFPTAQIIDQAGDLAGRDDSLGRFALDQCGAHEYWGVSGHQHLRP